MDPRTGMNRYGTGTTRTMHIDCRECFRCLIEAKRRAESGGDNPEDHWGMYDDLGRPIHSASYTRGYGPS